jgi:hypothetical protein
MVFISMITVSFVVFPLHQQVFVSTVICFAAYSRNLRPITTFMTSGSTRVLACFCVNLSFESNCVGPKTKCKNSFAN